MNGGWPRTVVGWWNWRNSTHESKVATHYRSARPRRDTRATWHSSFVLRREMAGVEDMELHVRQVTLVRMGAVRREDSAEKTKSPLPQTISVGGLRFGKPSDCFGSTTPKPVPA